jgi:hypothetical protein
MSASPIPLHSVPPDARMGWGEGRSGRARDPRRRRYRAFPCIIGSSRGMSGWDLWDRGRRTGRRVDGPNRMWNGARRSDAEPAGLGHGGGRQATSHVGVSGSLRGAKGVEYKPESSHPTPLK